MELAIYNIQGKATSKKAKINDEVLAVENKNNDI